MKRKFTFLIAAMALMIAIIGSGAEAWGAEGDTHDFSQSISQLLNNNASIPSINISEQAYPVKTVTVTCSYNKAITDAVSISVSVGENSWGSQTISGKCTNLQVEFNGTSTIGAISISFTNNTGSGTGHGTFSVSNVRLTEGSSGSGPSISCANITDVPYEGVTDAEAEVTFTNADGWTPSVTCDGTIVTAASLSGNTVTYSVSENTGSTDRTGNFTITLSKENEENVSKVVSVTQNHLIVDYATLPFSYDGGKDNLPDGLTQNELGDDYSSSPKMKFDGTGDYVILKINENPGTLRYTIKGNSFSGGTFTLQTSVNGVNYTDKKAYTTLEGTQTETITDLDASVRYIKWIYTIKDKGNVALGAIQLAKEGVKIPTFSISAGNYYESQSVVLTQANNKPIYYTTDEGDPTTAGTLYSEAISVNLTCTIKAAAKDGEEWSEVVSATYKIAQTYNSVAAVNAIKEDDIPIIISMSNWTITSISGYNMYVYDGTTGDPTPTIHVFDYQIPASYLENGTLSGSLKAVWDVNYTSVNSVQNWLDMSYSNPKYAINIDDGMENGSITSTPSSEAEVGATVTLTVAPEDGYRMVASSLVILDDNATTVTCSGNNPYTFTMPASAVEISAEFEEIPTTKYSYMYSVNGIDGSETEVAEGTVITLADSEDLNDDFKFAGWTIDENDISNILSAGSGYTMDADAIFYAVYSHTVGAVAGSGSFEKVTTLNDITAGQYVIVNDGYALPNVTITDASPVKTNDYKPTIANDVITTLPNNTTWLFTGSNVSMTIKNTDNKYLYATDSNNGLRVSNTSDTWAFETNGNGFAMKESNNSRYCATYRTGSDWRSYTSKNHSNYGDSGTLYLYKKDEGIPGTTNYFTRVLPDGPATSDITISGPTTIPAGSILDMGDFTLTNSNPANLVIADGGQLIINNAGVQAIVKKTVEKSTTSKASNVNWYTISSPLAANTLFANVTNLLPEGGVIATTYDLYRLDEANGIWENSRVHENPENEESDIIANSDFTTIDKGRGYIYSRQSANAELEFKGEINVANVEQTVTKATNGYNLLGNPFSQNITMSNVAGTTASLAEGFYVLSNENTWGTKLTDAEIKPLQGFLVQATTAGTVTISKPSASKGERSTENHANIEVIVENSNCSDNAYAMFGEGIGLNKINHRNADAPMVYIPQNNADFAIAFMSESTTVFPVSFKAATTGYYTISLKSSQTYEGINDFDYMHLIDNMTGVETDMLLEDGYRFIGSPADNPNRFTVTLHRDGIDENEDENENFVYQNGNNLIINGEGTLQIFDMLGRIVISQQFNGGSISTENLTSGVYVIRLTGNNVKSQKIIIR